MTGADHSLANRAQDCGKVWRMRVCLNDIESTHQGFERLIELYHHARACTEAVLEVDMSGLGWMDANMCAALGAVLYPLRQAGRTLKLFGMRPGLEEILQKNAFLPNFGFDRGRRHDTHGTTIEYQRFERGDAGSFKAYVARHFVGKGIPDMSEMLHRKFRESISELFDNAVKHSQSQLGIFACGQLFPAKARLDFSVADLGIGMRANILQKTRLAMTPEAAIAWAMMGGTTTRRPEDGLPGGLGLKIIWEFITLNGGSIQIASDAGYWKTQGNRVETLRFAHPFPGTVVNIEINTADTDSYRLTTEIEPGDIPF